MRDIKTKNMKLAILIILLFALFHIGKFIKVRISNMDLPKGKVVFFSHVDGDYEIYTMNINGSNLRQLTKNSASITDSAIDDEPSFSPDGREIVFSSGRQGQDTEFIYDYQGRVIGTGSAKTGTSDIYIMNSDGKNQIPLTYNTLNSDPFFSPDGKKIIFNSLLIGNHTLTRMIDIDIREERILSFGGGQVEFSSDGKKIFDNFENDISVINIDGTNRIKLTHFSGSQGTSDSKPGIAFALSSGGEKLAFVTIEGKNNHINRLFNFYIMNMDGSDLKKIYKLEAMQAPGFIFTFRYSPNEKYVVFNADLNESGIYLLNPKEETLVNLSKEKENWSRILDFAFTPDGKKIVFVADTYPKNYYFHAVILRNLKAYINYFLFRKQTPYYDNKYICIMDIDGKNYRRIAKLPVGTELGRDFIHWEEK